MSDRINVNYINQCYVAIEDGVFTESEWNDRYGQEKGDSLLSDIIVRDALKIFFFAFGLDINIFKKDAKDKGQIVLPGEKIDMWNVLERKRIEEMITEDKIISEKMDVGIASFMRIIYLRKRKVSKDIWKNIKEDNITSLPFDFLVLVYEFLVNTIKCADNLSDKEKKFYCNKIIVKADIISARLSGEYNIMSRCIAGTFANFNETEEVHLPAILYWQNATLKEKLLYDIFNAYMDYVEGIDKLAGFVEIRDTSQRTSDVNEVRGIYSDIRIEDIIEDFEKNKLSDNRFKIAFDMEKLKHSTRLRSKEKYILRRKKADFMENCDPIKLTPERYEKMHSMSTELFENIKLVLGLSEKQIEDVRMLVDSVNELPFEKNRYQEYIKEVEQRYYIKESEDECVKEDSAMQKSIGDILNDSQDLFEAFARIINNKIEELEKRPEEAKISKE